MLHRCRIIIVRRITGKSLGTFFKEEVAEPLKGDFHIGLPEKYDYRVGELIPPPPMAINQNSEIDPNSIAFKTGINPLMNPEETKTRAWRAAELPADNGHCNVRSVARITSAIACGGEVDGVHLLSIDTIEKALEEQSYGTDLVLMVPIRFGLGFGLQNKERPIGPNQRILYWGG